MKKYTVDTPRDGKAWCDTINTEPLPKPEPQKVLALGTCNADGSGFKPYPEPIVKDSPYLAKPSGSYLWLGDFKC